jgi:predicted SAM-dependent methyltransferase
MNSQVRFRIFVLIGIVLISAVQLLELGYTKAAYLAYRTRFTDPRMIGEYFNTHSVRKLQLGAGESNPDGWLNSDIEPTKGQIYLDAAAPYPFANGSFQYIFAEHLIEHLTWEKGLAMLKECYRALAPGGKIRIITPNLIKLVELLSRGDAEAKELMAAQRRLFGWPDTPVMAAYILNKVVREWGHQFIYDPTTLRKTLALAGFREITQYAVGSKTDPVFAKAEYRTHDLPKDVWMINEWGALAFEAVR